MSFLSFFRTRGSWAFIAEFIVVEAKQEYAGLPKVVPLVWPEHQEGHSARFHSGRGGGRRR